MNKISIITLILLGSSSISFSDEKENSALPLSEWSEEGQKSYIRTSFIMAGVIASQTDKNLERCIADWYAKTDELARQREEQVLDLLKQNPEHMPAAIILAIIEKKCGGYPSR